MKVEPVAGGTVTVKPGSASKGDTVRIITQPDSGYVLKDLTVKDASGKDLKLTDKGNGTYTFVMPSGRVMVSGVFEPDTGFFTDVPASAYYYEAVKWAQQQGITGGMGNGLFGSNLTCTRAQIITFLWRAAGSPEPKSLTMPSDVPSGAYYAKAVAWALEQGITTGTRDGRFDPNAACTRAQSVTFLYRALGSAAESRANFTDVPAGSYYAAAVDWAAENGVTGGIGGGLFGSSQPCTRAQIVTFLYRAYQEK